MTGGRRLSQAISEGDGISIIALVRDAASARSAEEAGAEGVALPGAAEGVRDATALPILYHVDGAAQDARQSGADACVLLVEGKEDGGRLEALHAAAVDLGLEVVVDVRDEDELEFALERLDPEIFMLSPREAEDDQTHLERILALLPDVPAGKLAVADLVSSTRAEVVALERAGVDAVLVASGDVASLVSGPPPEV